MLKENFSKLSIGTKSLILSKLYYSVLSKSVENLDIERYYSILHFLYENNGCNQQCICNNLAIDKTAMVKVIDYLIKADFVERKTNPEDRREFHIVLTKKGQKQTLQIVKSFNEIDELLFSSISNEEQLIFNKVMCQFSGKLKELPSNDLFFNYKKTSIAKKSK